MKIKKRKFFRGTDARIGSLFFSFKFRVIGQKCVVRSPLKSLCRKALKGFNLPKTEKLKG